MEWKRLTCVSFWDKQSTDAALYLDVISFVFLLEVDASILNRAAVQPLKSSYKGQLIWACYTGGRDMKVS